MEKIRFEDVSVVVQGSIFNTKDTGYYTKECITSIREMMPGAEIILSTWEDQPLGGLEYDKLLINKDPGKVEYKYNPKFENLNRQIVSTLEGIRSSSRMYVLKLRSESKILHLGFIENFFREIDRFGEFVILNERIVVPTILETKRSKVPFLLCDWYAFGLRSDVLNLWEIPPAVIYSDIGEKYASRFVRNEEIDVLNLDTFRNFVSRISSSEQYYYINFLDKNSSKIKAYHCTGGEKYSLYDLDELIKITNFTLLSMEQFGISSMKYPGLDTYGRNRDFDIFAEMVSKYREGGQIECKMTIGDWVKQSLYVVTENIKDYIRYEHFELFARIKRISKRHN